MYEIITNKLRIRRRNISEVMVFDLLEFPIPSSDRLRKRVGFLLLTDWISSIPRVVKSAFRHYVVLAIVAYQPATQLKIVTGSEKL